MGKFRSLNFKEADTLQSSAIQYVKQISLFLIDMLSFNSADKTFSSGGKYTEAINIKIKFPS